VIRVGGIRRIRFALPGWGIWPAGLWFGFIVLAGLAAALIPAPAAGAPLLPPSAAHWFGTDLLGRDLAWRLLAGGAGTVIVAGAALAVSVLFGGAWGVAAGLAGGWADRVLSRLMDIALAVPALVLALIILAALGPGDGAVVIAVGAGGAATFARLSRAETVAVRSREYITAARSLGAGPVRIALRHILPNIAAPLTAYAILHFGWAVVNAASLTFLGFGGSPSAPEWGRLLAEARLVFWQAPWQAAAPALALAATVLAVQYLGENLRLPAEFVRSPKGAFSMAADLPEGGRRQAVEKAE
jgi:peptide/nickel transport system permease protein